MRPEFDDLILYWLFSPKCAQKLLRWPVICLSIHSMWCSFQTISSLIKSLAIRCPFRNIIRAGFAW